MNTVGMKTCTSGIEQSIRRLRLTLGLVLSHSFLMGFAFGVGGLFRFGFGSLPYITFGKTRVSTNKTTTP